MKVKFHTKAKHWLLSNYLKICVDVQKKRKKPFFFVDLFCGDGRAVCKEPCPKWNGSVSCKCKNMWCEWDGSPLIAVKWAKKSEYPFRCIFNDIDENKIKSLILNLDDYLDYVEKIFNEDANKICAEILKIVPSSEHSLFFLDPQRHTELSWPTVEKIAKHTSKDWYGVDFERRPEILINLMTYTMQVDYKNNPKYIDRFMGTKKWREEVKLCIEKGEPIRNAFLKVYLERLKQFYENPFIVEIRQMNEPLEKPRSIIYYLIFVSSHPRAIKIFANFKRYIEKYKKEKLLKEYFKLQGGTSLDEFT